MADSARFYDAIRDGGEPFAEAAAREPGRLRIAISRKVPPRRRVARPDAEQLGALEGTADAAAHLGHEVVERELDWGTARGRTWSRATCAASTTRAPTVAAPASGSRAARAATSGSAA